MKILKRGAALAMAMFLVITSIVYSPALVRAAEGDTHVATVSIKLNGSDVTAGESSEAGTVKITDTEKKQGDTADIIEGTGATLEVTVEDGYQIKSITVAGESMPVTDNKATFSDTIDLTADADIKVEYETAKYSVRVNYTSANGTVTVADAAVESGGSVEVVKGTASTAIVATPNTDYEITEIIDNGTSLTESTLASIIDGDGTATYVISSIAADHDVDIVFSKVTYDFTYHIGANGKVFKSDDTEITDGSIVKVEKDTSTTIYIRANTGYMFKSLTIDGVETEVEFDEIKDCEKYTFATVAAAKNITVEFMEEPAADSDYSNYFTVELKSSDGTSTILPLRTYKENENTALEKQIVVVPAGAKVILTPKAPYTRISESRNSGYKSNETYTVSSVKEFTKLYVRKSSGAFSTQSVIYPVKYVVDSAVPVINSFSATDDKHDFFESFAVNVDVKDELSGLKSVEYYITDNAEDEPVNFTAGTDLDPIALSGITAGDLTYTGTIPVNVTNISNNTNNVKVHLIVKDQAGNKKESTFTANVSTAKPEFEISFGDTATRNNYYKLNRTATVSVKEVASMWDPVDVKKAIKSVIKKNGNAISDDEATAIIDMTNITKVDAADEEIRDTYTFGLNFTVDGNYSLDLDSLRNKAGNTYDVVSNAAQNPTSFVVDKLAPTVKVEFGTSFWEDFLSTITFGIYQKTATITGTNSIDDLSGIYKISYYKAEYTSQDDATAMTVAELDEKYEGGEFTDEPIIVSANAVWSGYVRVEDNAGNVAYGNSDGIITDVKPIDITLTPSTPNSNGFYKGNVNVGLSVVDQDINHARTGIDKVEYKIWTYASGVNPESVSFDAITESQIKQNGIFDGLGGIASYSNNITVNALDNNSNNTAVTVKAVDRAGNVTTKTIILKIDTVKPVIDIVYDNNTPSINGYYNASRTATITVTERNFSASDVKLTIKNTDGVVPTISNWTTSGSGDVTKHTATITYNADGDYTFDIAYTDLAGNECTSINFAAGTENAKSFTIDKTAPVATLSFDNNNVQNDKYYNAARVATIIVKEHNFDASRINADITASISGNAIPVPIVSWTHSGDNHVGTISFAADGDYTIALSLSDQAGNTGNSIPQQAFTIDTKIDKPVINGVENGKSYKEEVIPSIDFSDPNYKSHEITIKRTRANKLNEDVTAEFLSGASETSTGFTRTSDTFEKKIENDGIYTIELKVVDMAGNEESESVTFTVNRFGSVYAFNDYLVGLQKQYVREITGDLVITEYNPDQLVEGSVKIEITRDGTPLQNVKYTVSPTVNNTVAIGESGWYQYVYTISKENFEKDGVYKINVSSEDAAGNKPENTNYEENNILFRYDTTAPEIANVTGLEESIVNASNLKVGVEVFDAIGLAKVTIYNNDTVLTEVDSFDNLVNYKGEFELGQGSNQHVRMVIVDLAGNEFDTDARNESGQYAFAPSYKFERDVTVSTDFFVRLMANPAALAGVVGGAVVVVGGGTAGVVTFRKRRIKVK